MSDLIDRQKAIDALNGLGRYLLPNGFLANDVFNAIKQLPSEQPEIIRCKDCKHKYIENMVWVCPFGLPGGEEFYCGYGAEPYKGEQE